MARYRVRLARTDWRETTVEVEAETATEAAGLALEEARFYVEYEWDLVDSETEVEGMVEKDGE